MQSLRKLRLDQVERIYLAVLRIGILAVASICLLAAIWFAGDALWRVFVSTDVQTEPTVVEPSEVTAALRTTTPSRSTDDETGVPASVREAHSRFVRETFARYYAAYRAAAQAYNKSEDRLLTQEQLLEELDYGLQTYAGGIRRQTKLFVEDPDYQSQAIAAVTAAMSSPTTVRRLNEYKDTQPEQRCTTRNRTQRVQRTCGYYYSYDCSYTRTVPVRECRAVYPDGILSPLAAFEQADSAFARLWLTRSEANRVAAETTRSRREATRAPIGPLLLQSLQILGGFLAVMFFFLMVAIERHLRRMAETKATSEEPVAVEPEAD